MNRYTSADVALHNTRGDCWLIFKGEVYDVSHFEHPGGLNVLLRNGGKDATAKMLAVTAHSDNIDDVVTVLEHCKIGFVKD
jgi:cytochrome b involved in lipid metabolism